MISCKVCPGRVFPSTYAYNQHVQTSKAHSNKFSCTICSQSFPTFFARNGHLAKNHQDLLCRLCNRYYLTQDALKQHYRSDPRHPSCSQCEAAFPDAATLSRHARMVHPPPLREFKCHPCQVAFEDQKQLFEHFKSSGSHPLCLICDQGLADLPKFDEHVKSSHPELFCNICDVGCQSEDQLRSHYRSVASSLHPICDLCGEGFRDMVSLNEHTSISHDLSPVESSTSYHSDLYCLKCNLTFYHIIDLQGHFMSSSFHPTCIPCGQGFLDDVAYRIHLQTSHFASPSSRPSSKLSSPVLSPPRSLRSLVGSPRLQGTSATTSRVASPFPRNSSPTFFTSRSSRSTRSNSPRSSISPQPESRRDASTVVPLQPMVRSRASSLTFAYPSLNSNGWQTGIPAASVSPRPSSAPSTTQIIVTEPPQAGLEPPPATPIVTAPPPMQNTKRLGLRMPEPLCTVELMTPSVLGDESPTYESSRSSTPERLTTPSSLNSYNEDARSPTSPAPVQGHFTAAPSSVSLAGTSPASPASPAFSPPAVRAELDFGQPDTRTSSRVSFTTMATARKVADRVESPSRVSSPTTTEPVLNSPVVTTIPVEPTQEDISSEPYRAEYHGVDQCSSDARGSERVVDAKSSSDTSEYTADSEPPRKNPPTYTSRRSSSIQHSGRTQSRDTSSDSRTKVLSGQTSWHCRLCMDEPHEPTVTMCGHLFCHRCIVAELSKNFQCPVCKKMMLVRLHVD